MFARRGNDEKIFIIGRSAWVGGSRHEFPGRAAGEEKTG
jgi:hypothetical protein